VNVASHFSRSPKRWLHRSGIAGALTAGFFSLSLSVLAATSPCALTGDATVSAADVTAATNMALGTQTCSAQVEGNNVCTVITVQRVVNAVPNAYTGQRTYNGQPLCVTYNTHAAHLNWTASTTATVTSYNVYRATALAGPYTQIATLVLAATACNGTSCTWTDTSVTAGSTYYYEVTAVAVLVESAATSPILATIPSP
jgi:cellulose 1,4-beta-cellobiosidase